MSFNYINPAATAPGAIAMGDMVYNGQHYQSMVLMSDGVNPAPVSNIPPAGNEYGLYVRPIEKSKGVFEESDRHFLSDFNKCDYANLTTITETWPIV